ncbi:unnamed protein product [Cyprideis torosa]|uniref:Uncharacterized protein n=1 Tax=Cyprideis torosa TaxID=163714 RepID=A0A7R8W629_9CRUS|nr:unnamed protein product [Cyprideis torosa]CAG0881326.1 unnamed protein product [Cyprideis torosa]
MDTKNLKDWMRHQSEVDFSISEWPGSSLDLNPVERFGAIIEDAVQDHFRRSRNHSKATLREVIDTGIVFTLSCFQNPGELPLPQEEANKGIIHAIQYNHGNPHEPICCCDLIVYIHDSQLYELRNYFHVDWSTTGDSHGVNPGTPCRFNNLCLTPGRKTCYSSYEALGKAAKQMHASVIYSQGRAWIGGYRDLNWYMQRDVPKGARWVSYCQCDNDFCNGDFNTFFSENGPKFGKSSKFSDEKIPSSKKEKPDSQGISQDSKTKTGVKPPGNARHKKQSPALFMHEMFDPRNPMLYPNGGVRYQDRNLVLGEPLIQGVNEALHHAPYYPSVFESHEFSAGQMPNQDPAVSYQGHYAGLQPLAPQYSDIVDSSVVMYMDQMPVHPPQGSLNHPLETMPQNPQQTLQIFQQGYPQFVQDYESVYNPTEMMRQPTIEHIDTNHHLRQQGSFSPISFEGQYEQIENSRDSPLQGYFNPVGAEGQYIAQETELDHNPYSQGYMRIQQGPQDIETNHNPHLQGSFNHAEIQGEPQPMEANQNLQGLFNPVGFEGQYVPQQMETYQSSRLRGQFNYGGTDSQIPQQMEVNHNPRPQGSFNYIAIQREHSPQLLDTNQNPHLQGSFNPVGIERQHLPQQMERNHNSRLQGSFNPIGIERQHIPLPLDTKHNQHLPGSLYAEVVGQPQKLQHMEYTHASSPTKNAQHQHYVHIVREQGLNMPQRLGSSHYSIQESPHSIQIAGQQKRKVPQNLGSPYYSFLEETPHSTQIVDSQGPNQAQHVGLSYHSRPAENVPNDPPVYAFYQESGERYDHNQHPQTQSIGFRKNPSSLPQNAQHRLGTITLGQPGSHSIAQHRKIVAPRPQLNYKSQPPQVGGPQLNYKFQPQDITNQDAASNSNDPLLEVMVHLKRPTPDEAQQHQPQSPSTSQHYGDSEKYALNSQDDSTEDESLLRQSFEILLDLVSRMRTLLSLDLITKKVAVHKIKETFNQIYGPNIDPRLRDKILRKIVSAMAHRGKRVGKSIRTDHDVSKNLHKHLSTDDREDNQTNELEDSSFSELFRQLIHSSFQQLSTEKPDFSTRFPLRSGKQDDEANGIQPQWNQQDEPCVETLLGQENITEYPKIKLVIPIDRKRFAQSVSRGGKNVPRLPPATPARGGFFFFMFVPSLLWVGFHLRSSNTSEEDFFATFSNPTSQSVPYVLEEEMDYGDLRPTSFMCFVCNGNENEECNSMDPVELRGLGFLKSCSKDERTCKVRRYAYTTFNESGEASGEIVWAIKRQCSKACVEGCLEMGQRTRLYVCTSCCYNSSCNSGSGASPVAPLFPLAPNLLIQSHVVQAIMISALPLIWAPWERTS